MKLTTDEKAYAKFYNQIEANKTPNKAQHSPPLDYDIKHVDFRNLLTVVMGTISNQTGEPFDKAMLRTKSADEIWRRHNELKARADQLAEALRDLLVYGTGTTGMELAREDMEDRARAALATWEAAQ